MKASWVHVKKPFHYLDEILIPKLVHHHLFIYLYMHTYTFFYHHFFCNFIFLSPFLASANSYYVHLPQSMSTYSHAGYKTASQYELYYILYCKLWVNPTNVMSFNDMCDHRTGTCLTTNTFKSSPPRLSKRLLQ
jgi:hypothetical protein